MMEGRRMSQARASMTNQNQRVHALAMNLQVVEVGTQMIVAIAIQQEMTLAD